MIPHETNRGGFYVICPNVTNKINNGNEKVFYRSSGYGIFRPHVAGNKPKRMFP